MKNVLFILIIIFMASCESKNAENYPLKSEDGHFHAVVEIPAGTNKKYEFSPESISYEIDHRDGKDRVIRYLPYFGNYGFIPSTLSNKAEGGDGDPLDIIVIAESLSQGTLLPVIPLGTVKLMDQGEIDYKIIAVPANSDLDLLKIKTFQAFKSKYPSIIQIIEIWLTNYDSDSLLIEGWLDEKETETYILENAVTN